MPQKCTIPRVCRECGRNYLIKSSDARRGKCVFCSRDCWRAAFGTLEERFWSKVNKDGPLPASCPELGPCWLWTSAVTINPRNGMEYGILRVKGKDVRAARLAYELTTGPLAPGMLACHHCDVSLCCNPAHLFAGTHRDNMADMVAKGRSGRRIHPRPAPRLKHPRAPRKTRLPRGSLKVWRNCRVCDKRFGIPPSTVRRGYGFFCSRACWRLSLGDATARFWASVDQRGPDDCWIWKGKPHAATGYGRFTVDGTTFGAHRYAYILTHGPITDGLLVCHTCDARYPAGDISSRLCCNAAHMFLGSTADNFRDMHQKGRATQKRSRGEKRSNARLTEDDVRQIRAEYARGGIFQHQLAARYGVCQATMYEAISGKTWAHVH